MDPCLDPPKGLRPGTVGQLEEDPKPPSNSNRGFKEPSTQRFDSTHRFDVSVWPNAFLRDGVEKEPAAGGSGRGLQASRTILYIQLAKSSFSQVTDNFYISRRNRNPHKIFVGYLEFLCKPLQ